MSVWLLTCRQKKSWKKSSSQLFDYLIFVILLKSWIEKIYLQNTSLHKSRIRSTFRSKDYSWNENNKFKQWKPLKVIMLDLNFRLILTIFQIIHSRFDRFYNRPSKKSMSLMKIKLVQITKGKKKLKYNYSTKTFTV